MIFDQAEPGRNSRSGLSFYFAFSLAFSVDIYFVNPFHTCGEQFAHRRFFFILKFCARACSGYLFCQHNPKIQPSPLGPA